MENKNKTTNGNNKKHQLDEQSSANTTQENSSNKRVKVDEKREIKADEKRETKVEEKRVIKVEEKRETKVDKKRVIRPLHYLYPVIFKNKHNKLFRIHANIIRRSDIMQNMIQNNMVNLQNYYDEPEMTVRSSTLLNRVLEHVTIKQPGYSVDIKVCEFLHRYNITMDKYHCEWFARLSMFTPVGSSSMEAFDVSCISPDNQVFSHIVDHVVKTCKLPNRKWGYGNLLKHFNNQPLVYAVVEQIFKIAKH